MRPTALTLCLLAMPAAAADGPAAPGCRLTPAECARALHEVAADAEALAADGEVLGLGLSPSDRARALIQRDAKRMADRLRRLPGPVAAEIVRLQACGVMDSAAAGAAPPGPLCR